MRILERGKAFPKQTNFEDNMSTFISKLKPQPHFKEFNIATVHAMSEKIKYNSKRFSRFNGKLILWNERGSNRKYFSAN